MSYPSLFLPSINRYLKSHQIAQALVGAGVQVVDVVHQVGKAHAFVVLPPEADVSKELEKLKGFKLKGAKAPARENQKGIPSSWTPPGEGYDPTAPPTRQKRPRDEETLAKNVHDAVTPLWRKSFGEQLASKADAARVAVARVLRNVVLGYMKDIKAAFPAGIGGESLDSMRHSELRRRLPRWVDPENALFASLNGSQRGGGRLPERDLLVRDTPIGPILASAHLVGVRNKCTFPVQLRSDGTSSYAGHRLGAFSASTELTSAYATYQAPAEAKAVLSAFNEFLKTTKFKADAVSNDMGVWISLTVRVSETTGQVMVIVEARRPSKAENILSSDASTDAPGAKKPKEEESEKEVEGIEELFAQEVEQLRELFRGEIVGKPFVVANTPEDFEGEEGEEDKKVAIEKETVEMEDLFAEACGMPHGPERERALLEASARQAEQISRSHLWRMPAEELARAGLLPVGDTTPEEERPRTRAIISSAWIVYKDGSEEHLVGDRYIYEELCGQRFRISPQAFFQTNSRGMEVLYAKIGEHVAMSQERHPDAESTVLLDVCCGAGTIGLSAAHRVNAVVGIESCEPAVEDARFNAVTNGMHYSSVYIADKAENAFRAALEVVRMNPESKLSPDHYQRIRQSALESLLASARSGTPSPSDLEPLDSSFVLIEDDEPVFEEVSPAPPISAQACLPRRIPASLAPLVPRLPRVGDGQKTNLIAIVDPPRAGLHINTIKVLRSSFAIKSIIYVSCNPTGSFVQDAIALCALPRGLTKSAKGLPFRLVSAQPLDLFPSADHFELVAYFERLSPEETNYKTPNTEEDPEI